MKHRTQIYIERDEVMSPTVSMEGTLLTTVTKAQEGQDVATCDILCEIDPIYWDCVVTKGNQKVLYVHIT